MSTGAARLVDALAAAGVCHLFTLSGNQILSIFDATIGRGIGVLYQLRALAAGRGHLAVRREHLGIDRAVQATILRLSGTGIFQILIATTSWVGLTVVVTGFGSLAVAGYGIATRIVMFALMPSFGMANAAATLVGQNLGAGRPDRAEQAVWRASDRLPPPSRCGIVYND